MNRSVQTLSSIMIVAGFLAWALLSGTAEPLLALLAVGLHEAGHLTVALLCHVPMDGFRATSFEARIRLTGESVSYRKEACICLAGPFANVLTASLLYPVGGRILQTDPLSFFCTVSIALAILNLLPISDFDGGRILYCLISPLLDPNIASALCRICSFFSLFFLWSISVYVLLRTGGNFSLFFFSVSLFSKIIANDHSL